MDPLKFDALLAIGLTLLVWTQLFVFNVMRPAFVRPEWIRKAAVGAEAIANPPGAGIATTPEWLPYLLAAGVFLPLIIRREIPWLALGLSGVFTIAYAASPMPAAFTILGPMVAMYSVAAFSKHWHRSVLGVLVAGFLGAGVVFAFTSDFRGVMEIISAFVMLAAAAFLGDTTRNRREYVAEVEQRAMLAVQAQEEEALRRIDEERIEIAREVHDVVAHSLSIVAVQASAAETLLEDDPDKARESIANIRATSKDALGELRSMLEVLRTGADAPTAPSADLGQIDQLVEPVREAGLTVDLDMQGDIGAVPAFVSVSAYRIVQEALTNVVRHAQADSVSVAVSVMPRTLTLTVADNGVGASQTATDSTAGHGLRGMSERVEALGGTFSAGSAKAGSGYTVTATIPFPGGTS